MRGGKIGWQVGAGVHGQMESHWLPNSNDYAYVFILRPQRAKRPSPERYDAKSNLLAATTPAKGCESHNG